MPDDGWTSVELVLKKDWRDRLPDLLGLARFLISSITFLETVNTISVSLAKTPILRVWKKVDLGLQVDIPLTKSSSGIMGIRSIDFASMCLTLPCCSFLKFSV